MSRCLADKSIEHVVLERGAVANSWRTQRWDSLRLLTPNWMTRLPGQSYAGDDPDGYLSAPEFVDFVTSYAKVTAAPVVTGAAVTSIRTVSSGAAAAEFDAHTELGTWRARCVMLAPGLTRADLPPVADLLPADVV